MSLGRLFIILLVVGAIYWVFATFDLLDIFAVVFIGASLLGLGAVTIAILRARGGSHG